VSTNGGITAAASCANGIPLAAAPNNINAGDLVMACDTNRAYIFKAGAFAGGVLPVGGPGVPANLSATLSCASFGQSGYVAPYEADYWYVGLAGVGAPANTLSLYRQRYIGGAARADEIIRGVRQLLITYHIIGATNFVTATTVGAAWSSVDAVRVSLTLQSLDARAGVGANVATPLLRTFTTTIGIR
jgi:type IV pilus assembly protein PilW